MEGRNLNQRCIETGSGRYWRAFSEGALLSFCLIVVLGSLLPLLNLDFKIRVSIWLAGWWAWLSVSPFLVENVKWQEWSLDTS